MWETSTIETADKPLLKTPICDSINQDDVLESLGKYTFVAHFEADDFTQKIINLLKQSDSTKMNRLPAPGEKNSAVSA